MTTYADPGYISDVIGGGQPGRMEASWANAIRDRVNHHFADTTARDAAIASPTTGMVCYVTGTNTIYAYNGTTWLAYDNAVQTYTPTISQGASSNIAKTVNEARYLRRWNTCRVWLSLTATAAGTAGSEVRVTLPVAQSGTLSNGITLGMGVYADTGTATYLVEALMQTTGNNIRFRSYSTGNLIGVSPNIAVASTDVINCSVEYTIA